MAKYVYFFGGGKADGNGDMKNLLGGKGANLAEMTNIGLPVPAGFTMTTELCTICPRQKNSRRTEGRSRRRHAKRRRSWAKFGDRRIRCWSPAAPVPATPCPA